MLFSTASLVSLLAGMSILYALSCYVMIVLLVYIMFSITLFELRHPIIFEDFIDKHQMPVPFENQQEFEKDVQRGQQNIRHKKLVIGCLARNINDNFKSMKNKLEIIGSKFQDYKIVIFENDSEDGSRQLFHDWSSINQKVILLECCAYHDCDCRFNSKKMYDLGMRSSARMDNMRFFRQKVLSYVQTHLSHYDYFMVIDFDLQGAVFLDGFYSTFRDDDWDMVFSNGLSTVPFLDLVIYDSLAFIGTHQSFDYLDKITHELYSMNTILKPSKIGSPWIPCKSGFNGMAVYRLKSLEACSYDSSQRHHKCEHIDLHHDMFRNKKTRIFFNPGMILFAGHQGPRRKDMVFSILLGKI